MGWTTALPDDRDPWGQASRKPTPEESRWIEEKSRREEERLSQREKDLGGPEGVKVAIQQLFDSLVAKAGLKTVQQMYSVVGLSYRMEEERGLEMLEMLEQIQAYLEEWEG